MAIPETLEAAWVAVTIETSVRNTAMGTVSVTTEDPSCPQPSQLCVSVVSGGSGVTVVKVAAPVPVPVAVAQSTVTVYVMQVVTVTSCAGLVLHTAVYVTVEVIVSTLVAGDAPAIDMLAGYTSKGDALATDALVSEAPMREALAREVLTRRVLAGGVLAREAPAREALARGVLASEGLELEVALEVLFAPSAGAGDGSMVPAASGLRYTVNRTSGPAARRVELVFFPPQYSVELPGQTVSQLVR